MKKYIIFLVLFAFSNLFASTKAISCDVLDIALNRLISAIKINESVYSVDRDLIEFVEKDGMYNLVNSKLYGKTPLYLAVALGRVKYVRYLIENGAKPDSRDESGITPIILAENLKSNSSEHQKIANILNFVNDLRGIVKMDCSIQNADEVFAKNTPMEIANKRGLVASVKIMQDCFGFKQKPVAEI